MTSEKKKKNGRKRFFKFLYSYVKFKFRIYQ